MKTKQTAVEWLIEHIKLDALYEAKTMDEWINVFDYAKAMEKEQMRDLFLIGDEDGFKRCYYHNNHNNIDFDEYYNETYLSNEKN